MNWRKNPTRNWKLYCIIDKEVIKGKGPVRVAHKLLAEGVRVIQLRYKNYPSYELARIAKKIRNAAHKYKAGVIVDDRVDVALASSLGVHLGKGDPPVKMAREFLGSYATIGKTLHSLEDAEEAAHENLTYASAGPVFSTPLKKNLKKKGIKFIKSIKNKIEVPLFAIGGINQKNVKRLLENGVDKVCVTRAIFQAQNILKELKSYGLRVKAGL